jgi:hypothetical protein
MDIATITDFFKCCSIINFSILLIVSIIIMMTKDFTYNVHSKLGVWEGSKEAHKQSMYSILGNYKMLIIVFNVVPYFALSCCISN